MLKDPMAVKERMHGNMSAAILPEDMTPAFASMRGPVEKYFWTIARHTPVGKPGTMPEKKAGFEVV